MHTTKKYTKQVAALLALAACSTVAQAQTSDSLIDKLVDKGVLTVKEANELRAESDNEFTKAFQVKTGLPDWVTSMKIGGDIRGRYELFKSDFPGTAAVGAVPGFPAEAASPAFVDRHRFRYRLRLGLTATLKEYMEVGLRLTSSEPASGIAGSGDPISGNSTLQDNGSKKPIFIDLAYGKWSRGIGDWSFALGIGKMENPFVVSDMVFDGDYTPEGAMQQISYKLNEKHKLSGNTGEFLIDELGGDSNDPYLLGAQLRFDSAWTPKFSSTFGIAAFTLENEELLTTAAVPNQNRGNTRAPLLFGGATSPLATSLVNDYRPVVFDGALTYSLDKAPFYKGAFPIRIGGDYMHNSGADDENEGYQGGITFGKAGKKGTWELGYRYKHLEADAWYEEFVDSDFGAVYGSRAPAGGAAGYGSGTNVKGHIFKGAWSPTDSFTLSCTYFLTELINETPRGIDNQTTRVQVDASWKF